MGMTSFSDLQYEFFTIETGHHLNNARPGWVNFEQIYTDFPNLRNLSRYDICEWLCLNTAVISSNQAKKNRINEVVETRRGSPSILMRPPGYGRACVIEVDGGIVDVKGIGTSDSKEPTFGKDSNGVMSIYKAMIELIWEMVCRHGAIRLER